MGAERPQKKFDWRDVDCFCQGKLSKAADTDAVIPEGTSMPREKKYRRYRKGIKGSTTVEHKKGRVNWHQPKPTQELGSLFDTFTNASSPLSSLALDRCINRQGLRKLSFFLFYRRPASPGGYLIVID